MREFFKKSTISFIVFPRLIWCHVFRKFSNMNLTIGDISFNIVPYKCGGAELSKLF